MGPKLDQLKTDLIYSWSSIWSSICIILLTNKLTNRQINGDEFNTSLEEVIKHKTSKSNKMAAKIGGKTIFEKSRQ